jgi:putative ABC transport system permease protein
MHFLKTFLRNFSHNWLYTAINVIGLAIGLACFAFILLFILDELSYDKYNKDFKRIYRLESDITISDKSQQVAKSSFAIGPTFKKEFPEVEEFVRFRSVDNSFLKYGDKQFYEDLLYYTDSSVFNVFDHQFIFGSPSHALTESNSIVLTRSLAKKYFGDTNPVGQVMNLGNVINCKVTAVIEDVPANTHLKFSGLISMVSYTQIIGETMFHDLSSIHFWAIRLFTYIKINEQTSIESIHQKFPAFHDKYIADISKRLNGTYNLLTTRLDKIHLYSDLEWDLPTGDYMTIYVFAIIALIILLIACINYMNLATARSAHKAKEVGIRKVLGAHRNNLARSLIGESVFLSMLSLILSVMIVESFLPFINDLLDKNLTFRLAENPVSFLILLLVTLVVGALAGSYPALYLSSFKPVVVLKGVVNTGRNSGRLRKTLIVFQFTISICMIAGTFIVTRQMNFIRERDLGFRKENVLVVRSTDTTFKKQANSFKAELLRNPNIYNVSTSSIIPGGGNHLDVFLVEADDKMDEQLISFLWVDYNFIDLMGMKIIKGRNFSKKHGTDREQAVMINWKTAEKFGWNEDALGKEIHRRSYETEEFKVIGVIDNFNFNSLYEEVSPVIFFLERSPQDILTIRINPKNKGQTISYISDLWKKTNPSEPFKYDYLEDILEEHYLSDVKLQKIITYFALLSIFISLLGLFGLSSFITEQFSKNIGIRKLLGASVRSIVYLLSGDFLKLILIAFVIATPIAWFAMERWLEHFAYRLTINFTWFIFTGLLVLIFAQITVIVQTIKSALTNPVDVIRYE